VAKADTPMYDYKANFTASPQTSPFTTTSKLEEFVSPILSNGPDWLSKNGVYPTGGGTCYGAGNLAPMAEWQQGVGDAFYSKDVSSWPILFTTFHSHYRQHSFLDSNKLLQDNYRHAVWLSVIDAQARGVKDGDLVHVFNEQGEMIVPAYVTNRLVPGTGCNSESAWYMADPTRKTALMPDGIDIRGNCNLIDRIIDVPYTINGYLNCHGLAQVEKAK